MTFAPVELAVLDDGLVFETVVTVVEGENGAQIDPFEWPGITGYVDVEIGQLVLDPFPIAEGLETLRFER